MPQRAQRESWDNDNKESGVSSWSSAQSPCAHLCVRRHLHLRVWHHLHGACELHGIGVHGTSERGRNWGEQQGGVNESREDEQGGVRASRKASRDACELGMRVGRRKSKPTTVRAKPVPVGDAAAPHMVGPHSTPQPYPFSHASSSTQFSPRSSSSSRPDARCLNLLLRHRCLPLTIPPPSLEF